MLHLGTLSGASRGGLAGGERGAGAGFLVGTSSVYRISEYHRKNTAITSYPKNHWTLQRRGLDLYSRVLGSPNH